MRIICCRFGDKFSQWHVDNLKHMIDEYSVFGKVIEGMEHVDKIKRGDESNNGSVTDPDKIISFKSL